MQHSKSCLANFQSLRKAERIPQAVSRRTEPRSEWSRRGGRVLCKAGAIELDRLVAGLSLTAGGVLGVLVAGLFR